MTQFYFQGILHLDTKQTHFIVKSRIERLSFPSKIANSSLIVTTRKMMIRDATFLLPKRIILAQIFLQQKLFCFMY